MDFLKNVMKDVGEKGGQLVEVTKVNAKIMAEEANVKKLQAKLGEMVYADYKKGVSFEEHYNEVFSDLNLANETIEALKQEVADLKGVKLCQVCSGEIAQDAKFCIHCGAAQKSVPQEAEEEDEEHLEHCPNCNAELEAGAQFCPNCGQVLK